MIEKAHGFSPGDKVAPDPKLLRGDRGLFLTPSGKWIAIGLSTAPAVVSDLRTLPVQYDSFGCRGRGYKEAVQLLTETSFKDWPVNGPRTTRWLLAEISKQQMTPLQRHQWWRSLLKLAPTDPAVAEHEGLSRAFEALLTFDQVNASELASAEVLSRRLQLIEEHYGRQLLEAEAGADGGDRAFENSLFLGGDRSRGRALVSPALEEWIADKLKQEAAIMKERRKGREERQLARGSDAAASPPATGQQPGGGRRGK